MECKRIKGRQYAPDRPKDCRFCYFWENRKTGCMLGVDSCYYLLDEAESESECKNCPYGRVSPCVGWCTKKLLQEQDVARNEQG